MKRNVCQWTWLTTLNTGVWNIIEYCGFREQQSAHRRQVHESAVTWPPEFKAGQVQIKQTERVTVALPVVTAHLELAWHQNDIADCINWLDMDKKNSWKLPLYQLTESLWCTHYYILTNQWNCSKTKERHIKGTWNCTEQWYENYSWCIKKHTADCICSYH